MGLFWIVHGSACPNVFIAFAFEFPIAVIFPIHLTRLEMKHERIVAVRGTTDLYDKFHSREHGKLRHFHVALRKYPTTKQYSYKSQDGKDVVNASGICCGTTIHFIKPHISITFDDPLTIYETLQTGIIKISLYTCVYTYFKFVLTKP